MKPYVLAADVGGTTVKMGLFRSDGELVEKWEIPTRTEQGGEAILPDIAASFRSRLAERGAPLADAEGVGIGLPGPVDAGCTVYKCHNLNWWTVFNVREALNRLLPEVGTVAAGNDANVAALGELWRGGAMGRRSAVLFTLGTGVGGGVVLDGRIVAGANGGAGELGHITVEPEEAERCGCGKRGCLEQYASAGGFVRMARRAMAESAAPSPLRDMASFTAKDVCGLAAAGDEIARTAVERSGTYLGRAMSYVSCVVDPDVFVLGGGVSRAGELLLEPIRREYRRCAFHVSRETEVVFARLGNDAGIYGCAKMILGG